MAAPYQVGNKAATVLAQLCCHANQLPQGAPTSPVVSNLICRRLDGQLQLMAHRSGCLVSRYADDITFSTNRAVFPREIACLVSIGEDVSFGVGEDLERVIHDNGFTINPGKIRMSVASERQEVTGLVVNQQLNVPREFIRRIRAMLHAWRRYGLEKAEAEHLSRWRTREQNAHVGPARFEHVVWGRISYLAMIRGQDDAIVEKFRGQYASLIKRGERAKMNQAGS
jgi:RNA-directed DNA polymerase